MDNKFDINDFKKFDNSEYDNSNTSSSFTLDDILRDFNKESIKSDLNISSDEKSHSKIEQVDILKPEGVSITGTFEAIKNNQSNKSDNNLLVNDIPEEIANSEVNAVNNSKEIKEEIDHKRYFDTATFNSIKDSSNLKNQLSSFAKGVEDEEDDGEDMYFRPAEPTEEIDDYTDVEDREDVLSELKKLNANASFKALFTFVLLCVSGIMFATAYFNINLSIFSELGNNKLYLTIVLAISVISTIINYNSFISGVKSLIKFRCIPETLLSTIFIFSVMLDINYLISNVLPSGPYIIFDFIYMLMLFFNIFAKKIMAKNIYKNFMIVSSEGTKTVVNKPVAEEFANDIILETGNGGDIIYATKSDFVSDFINKSFKDFDLAEKHAFTDLLFLIIILSFSAVNYYINRSFAVSITYLLGALCAFTPILHAFSYALPIYCNSKKARKHGGAIVGSHSCKELDDVQTTIIDDSDVFTVALNGIRLYGDAMIDDAILYLNSLYNTVGGPLKRLFSQMLSNDITSLPRIDDIYYHDGLGYSGIIHSKTFVVGNKNIMEYFGIPVDDSEYEIIYQQKTKHVLFVAYDGKLMGVFLLSYSLSLGITKAFKIFEKDGVCVAIAERDSNINESTLLSNYKAKDAGLFKIMNFRIARNCFDKFITEKSTSSLIASNTGLKGVAAALHGCKNITFTVKANNIVKVISSILGFVLISFLLFFSDATSMLPIHILLYQALWSLPMLFLSFFSK